MDIFEEIKHLTESVANAEKYGPDEDETMKSWAKATRRTQERLDALTAQIEYNMECNFCSEIFPEDSFEDGWCPDCIKKRDHADSLLDRIQEEIGNMFVNQPVKD